MRPELRNVAGRKGDPVIACYANSARASTLIATSSDLHWKEVFPDLRAGVRPRLMFLDQIGDLPGRCAHASMWAAMQTQNPCRADLDQTRHGDFR
jgi:hypothetical protein